MLCAVESQEALNTPDCEVSIPSILDLQAPLPATVKLLVMVSAPVVVGLGLLYNMDVGVLSFKKSEPGGILA